MKNLITRNVKTVCQLVVCERAVTKVLNVLANYNLNTNISIGDCGWDNDDKWYIVFRASGKHMEQISETLRRAHLGEIIAVTGTNRWAKMKRFM